MRGVQAPGFFKWYYWWLISDSSFYKLLVALSFDYHKKNLRAKGKFFSFLYNKNNLDSKTLKKIREFNPFFLTFHFKLQVYTEHIITLIKMLKRQWSQRIPFYIRLCNIFKQWYDASCEHQVKVVAFRQWYDASY